MARIGWPAMRCVATSGDPVGWGRGDGPYARREAHLMHVRAAGRASRRGSPMSRPQTSQTP